MKAARIFAAQRRLRAVLPPTPMVRHPLLDTALGGEVWIKLENTTAIGAFKLRGGLELLATLDAPARRRGICAPTRGNHGQALAYAARRHGVSCVLFVPAGNSPDKNRAMRAFGAEVRVAGADFDQAHEAAERFAHDTGARYVHPGREPALVAGAGTIGLEMSRAVQQPFDDVFVPVGVGSLAAGVGMALAATSPTTRVHGVSARAAPAMQRAFDGGPADRRHPPAATLADGLAVGAPIAETLSIMRRHLHAMHLVDEHELARAMRLYATSIHQLAEGAGAAALAGALQQRDRLTGRRIGIVLSGGNVTLETFASLLDDCHRRTAPDVESDLVAATTNAWPSGSS